MTTDVARHATDTRPFAGLDVTVSDEVRERIDFVLGLRYHWANPLFRALRDDYGREAAAKGRWPRTAEEAAPLIERLPRHRMFGWYERNIQKMMWRALTEACEAQRDQLVAALNAPVPSPRGSLLLDPDLKLPSYYTETEFHVQPGGVWSEDLNAFVYELGAKIVFLGKNDDYAFHRLFTRTAIPDGPFKAILDLGCGFGKSARPFVDRFPEARVVGIDLSAPVLKLAHRQSEKLGKRVDYMQRLAEDTRFPDASFDLVTATMLIHEMPMPVVRKTLAEAYRVLRPGGRLVVLDYHRTGDPLRDFLMLGHARRNNEPFMGHILRVDTAALTREVGFTDVALLPFDERGAGPIEDGAWPRRDDWHFPWVVLRGRKT